MKGYDNVKLFNSIIKDVSSDINKSKIEFIMNKFEIFLFLKDILDRGTSIKSELVDNNMIFITESKSDKAFKNIKKLNEEKYMYKKKTYILNIKVKKGLNSLELVFKEDDWFHLLYFFASIIYLITYYYNE